MDTSSATVFHGDYAGNGFWVDVAGESKRYRIVQVIDVRESEICVRYEHDFFEEGTKTQGTFVLLRAGEQLLSVRMNGSQVGNGYIFGDVLHYHIRVGDAYVEVGYRGTERGMLVTGSSTKNAQGRFIAWQETLEKAA